MIRLNKTLIAGLVAVSTLGIAGAAQAQVSPSDLFSAAESNALVRFDVQHERAVRPSLEARAYYVAPQTEAGAAVDPDRNVRDAVVRDHFWSGTN